MYKRDGFDIKKRTKKCITYLWKKDLNVLESYLAEDVVIVGIARDLSGRGKEKVMELFRQFIGHITEGTVKFLDCEIAQINIRICVITGNYLVRTDQHMEGQGYFHTFTFVWEQKEKEKDIWLKHVHLSAQFQKQEKQFPIETHEGKWYFITESELLYVKADGKYTLFYLTDGICKKCKLKIDRVVETYGKNLYRVHRSYVINRSHVVGLSRYKLELSDGTAIPIPVKFYGKTVQDLLNP